VTINENLTELDGRPVVERVPTARWEMLDA